MVIIGPAGSAMQMFPPTVAEFHTLKDARKASQLIGSSDAAVQSAGAVSAYRSRMVHIAPISRPAPSATRESHPSGTRSMSRRTSGCRSENSHVPPAHPGAGSPPERPRPCGRLSDDFGDGGDVHGFPLLRSIRAASNDFMMFAARLEPIRM